MSRITNRQFKRQTLNDIADKMDEVEKLTILIRCLDEVRCDDGSEYDLNDQIYTMEQLIQQFKAVIGRALAVNGE